MVGFPIDSVASSLISLLIGGLLGRELFRILDKPSVTIQYRKPITFTQNDGTFLAVRVGNIGRNAATDCAATLTLFDITEDMILEQTKAEAFENLPEYKEESLDLDAPRYQIVDRMSQREIISDPICWSALGNPGQVNINPGTTQSVDICKLYVGKDKSYFIFPSEFGWRRVRIRLSSQKPIKCRILVCPSNDYPTPLDFELSKSERNLVFTRIEVSFFTRLQRFISRRTLYTK